MELVDVKNCSEGSVLAKPIYDERERLLLNKGAVLKKEQMSILSRFGIKEVYVEASAKTTTPPTQQGNSQVVNAKDYPNVSELGVIIDFSVHRTLFKSIEDSVENLVQFLNSLEKFGDFQVVFTTFDKENRPTEIKNFNYSVYNQSEGNDQYRVFRSYGAKIYIQHTEDIQLHETFPDLFWYGFNNDLFCINVSYLEKRQTPAKETTFYGTTKANSGEILEKAVTQQE